MTGFSANSPRRQTRLVRAGQLGIGGGEPIRIQSMLTSVTTDIYAVIREIENLNRLGCELIRITIPNRKALDSVPEIRRLMRLRGISIPLVADIHFNPQLAVDACESFEKVRINPGNYADRKKFEIREYSTAQYAEELERLEEKLLPLITQLKRYQRTLRIGTNHGSLSDRVMNRYGDTPEGMVQSVLEFLRIMRSHDFHDIVLSMKSSNPLLMMQAYRLLVHRMDEENMDYPLHLGVTEAGNGLEGRIKSAVGIGGLLCEGLGDTIRVSLTEPAENEIPAARAILKGAEAYLRAAVRDRETGSSMHSKLSRPANTERVELGSCAVGGNEPFRLLGIGDVSALCHSDDGFDAILEPDALEDSGTLFLMEEKDFDEFEKGAAVPEQNSRLILLGSPHPLADEGRLLSGLKDSGLSPPCGYILPSLTEHASETANEQQTNKHEINFAFAAGLAAELGELIANGALQCLVCPTSSTKSPEAEFARILLQSTRTRLYHADFISCPSCGRTFFDLQTVSNVVKQKTAHLKGVKVAVMGCIVNGPGEMADADFGYVGAGPGTVHLYHGQKCVERNIPSGKAVERLLALIRKHGAWIEPGGSKAA